MPAYHNFTLLALHHLYVGEGDFDPFRAETGEQGLAKITQHQESAGGIL